MAIRFACPKCRTAYTVRDGDAGKKSDCKVCGQRLQVPAPVRAKTVLGDILPSDGHPAPTPVAAPEPIPLEPAGSASSPEAPRSAAKPNPSAMTPATAAGPIRFNCPDCNAAFSVNR